MPYTGPNNPTKVSSFRAFMAKRSHFRSRPSANTSRTNSYDAPLSPGRTQFAPTFGRLDDVFQNPNPFAPKAKPVSADGNPFADVENPFAKNTLMRNDYVGPNMDQPWKIRDRRGGMTTKEPPPALPGRPVDTRFKQAKMPANGKPGQQSITSYLTRKPLPQNVTAGRPGVGSSRSSSSSKVTARSSPTSDPFQLLEGRDRMQILRLILVCKVVAANLPNNPGKLEIIDVDSGRKEMLPQLRQVLKGYPVRFQLDQQLGEGSTVTCGLQWNDRMLCVHGKDIIVRSKAIQAASIPNPLLTEGLRNKTVTATVSRDRKSAVITGIYGQNNPASAQLGRKTIRALYPICPHPAGAKISCGLRWDGSNLIVKDGYAF